MIVVAFQLLSHVQLFCRPIGLPMAMPGYFIAMDLKTRRTPGDYAFPFIRIVDRINHMLPERQFDYFAAGS